MWEKIWKTSEIFWKMSEIFWEMWEIFSENCGRTRKSVGNFARKCWSSHCTRELRTIISVWEIVNSSDCCIFLSRAYAYRTRVLCFLLSHLSHDSFKSLYFSWLWVCIADFNKQKTSTLLLFAVWQQIRDTLRCCFTAFLLVFWGCWGSGVTEATAKKQYL